MDRELSISFHTHGDVEYVFSRNDRPLHQYVIEHRADLVEILDADPGYGRSVTPEGWLRLSWPNNTRAGWSGVHYLKKNKLTPIEGTQLLRFNEDVKIKADSHFGLWLGSPYGSLSVVKDQSSAQFFEHGVPRAQHYTARQLAERVFRRSGRLEVRWILEPT